MNLGFSPKREGQPSNGQEVDLKFSSTKMLNAQQEINQTQKGKTHHYRNLNDFQENCVYWGLTWK